MKEGYKTTEFWVATLVSLVGVGAATGVISPEQQTELGNAITQAAGLLTSVLASFGYSVSRGSAKKNGKC